jgi:hemerythrin-like domain-containing protein
MAALTMLHHQAAHLLGMWGRGISEAVRSHSSIQDEMTEGARVPPVTSRASLAQVQAFQQAVEDHRFLSEYVANVQQSTDLFDEAQPHERLAAMKAFLAEHVVGHFAFEEKHVFPQLLARERAAPTRQAVAELVEEHRAMRADARNLRRRMRNVDASGNARALARLEQSFRGFLGLLQAHAVKEDNILLAVKQSRRHAIPLR